MKPAYKGNFISFEIKKWLKKNKPHYYMWGTFIIYETIIAGLLYNIWANPLTYFFHYLVTISLFYLHSDLSIPWALRIKKQVLLRLLLIVIFQISIYVVLHFQVDLFLIYTKLVLVKGPYTFSSSFILRNLYRGIFFMGFSTGYYFLRTYIAEKKRTAELEKEQLNAIIKQQSTEQALFKAQNAFLKAQINPHFLFNTLNFIYNKVNISSPEAADAVLSLSAMMRYAITANERGGTVKLEDEMEQTINLINLFKLRNSKPVYLEVEFAEKAKPLLFIPLVLLTIAENMFKHGQLYDSNRKATLKVYIEDEFLYFESYNLSQPQKSSRSHTGLENIKNRLTFAYGEQVSFEYATDADACFKLKLGIPLAQLKEPAL